MLIETKGAKQFLYNLRYHFDIKQTRLNETEDALTVFLDNPKLANTNIIIGRYCKLTGQGVILDRRKKVRDKE